MKLIIEDSLSLYSQLLVPILLVAIPGIIQIIIKIYLSLHGKNKYSKLLTTNVPYIKSFLNRINWYKISHVFIGSFLLFLVGFINGSLFEIYLMRSFYDIFIQILNINFISNLLINKLNLDYLNINMIRFNIIMIYISFLNISTILVFFVLMIWSQFLKSKHLLLPRITEYCYSTPMSSIIYVSYWFFIGVIIGINYVIYGLFFSYLFKYSLINENFSFNLAYFTDIYSNLHSNLMYPAFHVYMYLTGILASSVLIIGLYIITKRFAERIIELITRHYEYYFPYIKITTENGETEGRLKDIRNKSLITLGKKDELKIILWDKIEIMEVNHSIQNEHFVFNDNLIKKK